MPSTPLLGWAAQEKSRGAGRLLSVCLAGAMIACLALLLSRVATFDEALDIPYFLKAGWPAAVANPPRRQYSLVLGASHHKTGTVQLFCLGRTIRSVTDTNLVAQIGNVSASDVAEAIADAAAAAAAEGAAPGMPGLLLTGLPLSQQCYGRDEAVGDAFRCPVQEAPCNSDGDPILSLSGCYIHLPISDVGVWHYVRRPLDIVVSAYWYHQQQPAPEEWINREFSTRVSIMQQGGVPLQALAELGLGDEHERLSYGELVRLLPEEQGIQLEFWRSAPGLYAMARQFLILQRLPAAQQVRYEDAQQDFNGTVLRTVQAFFPRKHIQPILEAAQECDPTTWSSTQLSSSNHVTMGKHLPGSRERLQGVLLAQPEIRRHLCSLTETLGYAEPRCGSVEHRRLRQ